VVVVAGRLVGQLREAGRVGAAVEQQPVGAVGGVRQAQRHRQRRDQEHDQRRERDHEPRVHAVEPSR
jgi:hypothetical protein